MPKATRILDLIFFLVGGKSFSAPVDGLQFIAAADWMPRETLDHTLELHEVLGLPKGVGARVLVVQAGSGRVGIRVDTISARMIGSHVVHPVPTALAAWLHIQALIGVTADPDQGIIPVINLEKLATLEEPSC